MIWSQMNIRSYTSRHTKINRVPPSVIDDFSFSHIYIHIYIYIHTYILSLLTPILIFSWQITKAELTHTIRFGGYNFCFTFIFCFLKQCLISLLQSNWTRKCQTGEILPINVFFIVFRTGMPSSMLQQMKTQQNSYWQISLLRCFRNQLWLAFVHDFIFQVSYHM